MDRRAALAAGARILEIVTGEKGVRQRVLLLPGLGNSGPDHWQSHWEKANPEFTRVEQRDWYTPSAEIWVEQLNREIVSSSTPAILVAHSLGCSLVARWSREHRGPVAGAMLVAPSDVEAAIYPAGTTGFTPMLVESLPFRSIVVASSDDPWVSVERATEFARGWESEFVLLGPRGHIGSLAMLGLWPEGRTILQVLLNA